MVRIVTIEIFLNYQPKHLFPKAKEKIFLFPEIRKWKFFVFCLQ